MRVSLPPLFRVDCRENTNALQQLQEVGWTGDAQVEEYATGRSRGYVVHPKNRDSVLVLTGLGANHSGYAYAVRLKDAHVEGPEFDLSAARWISHPNKKASPIVLADYEAVVEEAWESWRDAFRYKAEDPSRGIQGLRPPQLGAVLAVQSHWTINRDDATIVLPTGVGKTETMISLLVAERCTRLLVIVPTDALRTQLAQKFVTLGLLRTPEFAVVAPDAHYPVVGVLNKRPQSAAEAESFVKKCNVVVTTMPLAGQCLPDVTAKLAELFPCLFIDEAHHVAAPKWKAFKEAFAQSRIVQFTATPFRNDDRPIGGRRLFTFSLRHAQEHGYFKQINFKPVIEFDPARKDSAIAAAAVEQLERDATLGHILMARVANVKRAEEVFDIYKRYEKFNPVQIHTGIESKVERDAIRLRLLSGESRIVVCVDMLGEGFDLPELKIAAFHDIRKTLAVTLQLAGRFTRSKPKLGNATFVANVADLDVKEELRRLYQNDSDWNAMLPLLSERALDNDVHLAEFLAGFQELPEDITLRNVRPAMSMTAYRTSCPQWHPERFGEGLRGFDDLDRCYHSVNYAENTLVIVTTQRVPVDWAAIDEIHNWDWQLYVLHWDRERGLLFIHNSSNSGFYKKLAQAVAGEVQQVRGPEVFRCLAGINRLRLQNVGLLEQLGRLIRYTMRAGSDVEAGITTAQKQKAIKSNLFGQGFENGQRVTIGCSYKGRIWSQRTTNLRELTRWCGHVGEKLVDAGLDPETVLKGTLVPKLIGKRPSKVPIAVDWPDIVYKEPESVFEFQTAERSIPMCHASLVLVNRDADGPLSFAVAAENCKFVFQQELRKIGENPDFTIRALTATASIAHRSRVMPLDDFFDMHPPTFWFADGSSLTGIEYVELSSSPQPFERERLIDWNWSGTNIRVESQGAKRDPESVQHRVICELKTRSFSVLFDDDDSGEAADVVAIAETTDQLEVEFWHCKYASENTPGTRIQELYELCGQAQKSVRWIEKPRDLFTHLLRREPRRAGTSSSTRFEIGSVSDLMRIREKTNSQRTLLRIYVVQPGLSKVRASPSQLELLAVTENYLMETLAVPFGVVASP